MVDTPRSAAWSQFEKVKVIGAGGSGQVFLVVPRGKAVPEGSVHPSSDFLVVKRIFVDNNPEQAECAATEARLLAMIPPHPNIVRYHGHFIDSEGYFNLVVDYCPAGDLEKLIGNCAAQETCSFTLRDVAWFTFQILCGVRHLHRHHTVHRDLKPGNLLLASGDLETTGTVPHHKLILKVADFGVSRIVETGGCAQTVIGTPFYLAPEICESKPYTSAADMWAVGCVVYEMCTLTKLFGGTSMLAVVRSITAGVVPDLPTGVFKPLEPLVRALVVHESAQRLTADQAIKTFFAPPPPKSVVVAAAEQENRRPRTEEL